MVMDALAALHKQLRKSTSDDHIMEFDSDYDFLLPLRVSTEFKKESYQNANETMACKVDNSSGG